LGWLEHPALRTLKFGIGNEWRYLDAFCDRAHLLGSDLQSCSMNPGVLVDILARPISA
jgi:hypothetical protein